MAQEKKQFESGLIVTVGKDLSLKITSDTTVNDKDEKFGARNNFAIDVQLYKIAEAVVKKTDNKLDDMFLSSLRTFLALVPKELSYAKKFEK